MVSTSRVVCSTSTPRHAYLILYACGGASAMAGAVGFGPVAAEEGVFRRDTRKRRNERRRSEKRDGGGR